MARSQEGQGVHWARTAQVEFARVQPVRVLNLSRLLI